MEDTEESTDYDRSDEDPTCTPRRNRSKPKTGKLLCDMKGSPNKKAYDFITFVGTPANLLKLLVQPLCHARFHWRVPPPSKTLSKTNKTNQ